MPQDDLKVDRKIQFFELVLPDGDDRLDVDPVELLRPVQNRMKKGTNIYIQPSRGRRVCATKCVPRGTPARLVLSTGRTTDWSREELEGNLTDIRMRDGAAQADTSYMTFFDSNVVGLLTDPGGPRVGAFEKYLSVKTLPKFKELRVMPLVHLRGLEQLRNYRAFSSIEYELRLPTLVSKEKTQGFGFWTGQTEPVPTNTEVIRATVSVDARRQRDGLDGAKSYIRSLWKSLRSVGFIKRFRLKGSEDEDSGFKPVDLLVDHLVTVETVVKASRKQRTISESAAFQAIENAYDRLRGEIESAVTVEG